LFLRTAVVMMMFTPQHSPHLLDVVSCHAPRSCCLNAGEHENPALFDQRSYPLPDSQMESLSTTITTRDAASYLLALGAPSYQYQPLQHSDSIRVIVLHPSPNESDPIECTICQDRLSNGSLEYEAVSYTWGNSGLTHVIHCNDARQRLRVGRNCHAALRRLRLPKERRKLWIDAVCINQEDLLERGHQVRIMKDVYDFASGVMVMLNDEVPECRLLLDELAEVISILKSGADLVRSPPCSAILRQLENLFEDPWFKRTWVLQEVHGKDCVTIMYGSAAIPFVAIRKLYSGYTSTRATRISWPLPLDIMISHPIEFHTSQFRLWNLLYKSRECLATNPRDRVFALKALVGSRQSEMDYLVDYTQSVEQCFKQVATFLLPVVGLRILTATRHPHDLGMASWIPDWSQNLPLQFKSFWDEIARDGYHDDSFQPPAWQPPRVMVYEHALKPWIYEDSYPSPTLRVFGFQDAQIVECSQVFQFASVDDAERQMRKIYNQFSSIRLHLNEKSRSDSPPTPDIFSWGIFDSKVHNSMQDTQH